MQLRSFQHIATAVLCWAVAWTALPAPGCTDVTVHTAINPAGSFEHYRTFSFGSVEGPPRGYTLSRWSEEARNRAEPLIAAALTQKGYAWVADKGDLLVNFGSGQRVVKVEKAEPREGDQSLLGMPRFVYDVVNGAMVVDAFDGLNGALAWHGTIRAEIQPDRLDTPMLQTLIDELIRRFPAASAPAKGGVSSVAAEGMPMR
jgi:hypothetical protein